MKHISVIVGGGHPNGDIAHLVDSFVCGAKEAGHKVKKISLSKIEIRG